MSTEKHTPERATPTKVDEILARPSGTQAMIELCEHARDLQSQRDELLEALQAICGMVEVDKDIDEPAYYPKRMWEDTRCFQMARTAIAKATTPDQTKP